MSKDNHFNKRSSEDDNKANEESAFKRSRVEDASEDQFFTPYSEDKSEEEELHNLKKALKNGTLKVDAIDPIKKQTYLDKAIIKGHVEVINELLKAGANIEARGEDQFKLTPLLAAASNGHVGAVEALLKAGANIEARGEDQFKLTPLLAAASNGHVGAVEALLKAGANIEARSEGQLKYTPLLAAAGKGHVGAVEALLKAGANIEAGSDDQFKYTPLLVAAGNGHVGAVEALLKAGANIEAGSDDQFKYTPLLVAAGNGHVGAVKLLLKSACEPSLKTEARVAPPFSPEIQEFVKIAAAVKNISLLENAQNNAQNIEWELLYQHKDFALEIFHSVLVKSGIEFDSFDDYKLKLINYYQNKMPNDLLQDVTKTIDEEKKVYDQKLCLIEASLISIMHNISPMPYRAEEEKDYPRTFDSTKATSSGTKETDKYNEFWGDPLNQKYKTAGTYLLECAQNNSSLNILGLTEILLRANLTEEEILKSCDPHQGVVLSKIKGDILELNKNIVLPKNIKTGLQNVIKQYHKYKDDPLAKTAIAHEDEIETLKQAKAIQENRLSKLEEVIKALSHQIGFNPSSLDDNDQHMPLKNAISNDMDVLGDSFHNNSSHEGTYH